MAQGFNRSVHFFLFISAAPNRFLLELSSLCVCVLQLFTYAPRVKTHAEVNNQRNTSRGIAAARVGVSSAFVRAHLFICCTYGDLKW